MGGLLRGDALSLQRLAKSNSTHLTELQLNCCVQDLPLKGVTQ